MASRLSFNQGVYDMRKLLLLAAVAAMVPASAQAVSIVNGSFEMATVNPGGGFVTLGNGDASITGWIVGGLGIDYIGGYWQPADGKRSIDLSGNNKGSISQLLSGLTVGKEYTVNFSLAGNPDGGSASKLAVVSDGGSQADGYFFVQAGNTKPNMGWTREQFKFIATGTTANLTFSATKFDAFGPALDNVSLGGVPEPSTWALMIVGFGVVGGAMRRRNATRTTVRFA